MSSPRGSRTRERARTPARISVVGADHGTDCDPVFDLTGNPPAFFYCDVTFDDNFFELADLASENVTFTCQVASGCAALPCEVEWHPIGGAAITLPGSFFLP